MNLRDHDRACEHTRWAYKEEFKGWMCGDIDCPGGAAVSVDYNEAGIAVHAYTAPFGVMNWDLDETVLTSTETAQLIVDAALGVSAETVV